MAKPQQRGPSKRGAGAFFDSKVTQEPWQTPEHASKCMKTLKEEIKRGDKRCFCSKFLHFCLIFSMSQEFLKVNRLKVLLRSHEKRQEGFSVEHANSKGPLGVF